MAKERIETMVGIILFYALIVLGVCILSNQADSIGTRGNNISQIR